MSVVQTKVLVIGAGPGGYVAAIRCGQLGLDTVLVDADRPGGTCLLRGCIPSKSIIQAASEFSRSLETAGRSRLGIHLQAAPQLRFNELIGWKDGVVDRLSKGVEGLLRRANVKVIRGWATFTDAKTCHVANNGEAVRYHAEHVILATGSKPVELSALPASKKVISSAEALALSELPDRMVIVGGGYIGLELGCAFSKFGTEVTIVESKDRILPQYDAQLVAPLAKWLAEKGVQVCLGATALAEKPAGLLVRQADGKNQIIRADKILVTAGRRPLTEGWGLEQMALEMDGPFVRVNDQCATSSRNVWAIGDLVGEPMLAHKASAQGEVVAENIAGKPCRFDPIAIPEVCFTDPEIVCVGKGPDTEGSISASYPFSGNGRALTMGAGDTSGFVRIVADAGNHRVLGVQAVGSNVSELSSSFSIAIEMGAVLEDVAGVIQAHPTLGEAFHESALRALGRPLHV